MRHVQQLGIAHAITLVPSFLSCVAYYCTIMISIIKIGSKISSIPHQRHGADIKD